MSKPVRTENFVFMVFQVYKIYIYSIPIPQIRDDEPSSQAQPPMSIRRFAPPWGWLWVSQVSQGRRGPSQVLDSRLALYTDWAN